MKHDADILRTLGLMLAKEEHSSARRPRPVMSPGSVCAWCQKEAGVPGQPGENHGICERHRAEMDAEIEQLHAPKKAA